MTDGIYIMKSSVVYLSSCLIINAMRCVLKCNELKCKLLEIQNLFNECCDESWEKEVYSAVDYTTMYKHTETWNKL